jgi:UDP-2,3-diacylglucosamine hydrolase
MGKLGLIAGGGGLPVEIAEECCARGRPIFVVRLAGMADPALQAFPGDEAGVAELGRCVRLLRRAGCEQVCFAGIVRRPADFSALRPDLQALKYLPRVVAAARGGDDALLRAILGVFESEGFEVEGVGHAAASLRLGPGPLGAVAPEESHLKDIQMAMKAAREVGRTDVAQGAVARGGEVIALEGADGTDAMLARLAHASGERRGVLAKLPKPAQDRRVDLPTIGVRTIERAADAGLAGIVGASDGLLVVDRIAVRATADRLGLFVLGVEGQEGTPSPPAEAP